jgi:lipopolysaccharide transport system permease protein
MNANLSDSLDSLGTKPPTVAVISDALTRQTGRPPADAKRPVVIESEESGVRFDLGELWRYRELLYFLTLRDIKVRYKQTLLGVTWVLIQPLLTMLIFTLVFNRFVRLETGKMPYPLFALSGLVLWFFFANAVTNCASSLVLNAHLITKVYFPRMYIPAATIGTGLVDLAVSLLLLIAVAFYYGTAWTWSALLLPVFILMLALLALGVGFLFAAFTVKYRDLRHALPFLIQIWMFASPVIYPLSIVPERWRWFVLINPIAAILEGFRAALSGRAFDWLHLSIAAAIILTTFALSLYIFRRAEDNFADII